MDTDPNDLLSTNTFINEPVLEDVVPEQFNEEFRQYYKSEIEKKNMKEIQSKIDLRSSIADEDTDMGNLLNTNKFTLNKDNYTISDTNTISDTIVKRIKKDKKTLISIDSRDRNKILHPLASNFEIDLGKSFYNVREVRLVSIEFPNTHAVINQTNNFIYWINQEDIDEGIINSRTMTYPVYKAQLRTGSYISSTLQNEITNKMNAVKRRNNTGDNHYFIVTLDIDTDIVTFLSLKVQQLIGVNLISVSLNTPTVTITLINNQKHNYTNNDNVYIIGATQVGGIPSSNINGFHRITVVNDYVFTYDAGLRATESATGGGNNLKAGISAPFQFLYGEYPRTVSQNIGYPIENSSVLIQNYLREIKNYFLLQLTAKSDIFSDYDIGSVITVSNTQNTSLNKSYTIINVLNSKNILIEYDELLYTDVLEEQFDNDNGVGSVVKSRFENTTSSATIMNISGSTITVDNLGTAAIGHWVKVTTFHSPAYLLIRRIINIDTSTKTITLNQPFAINPVISDTVEIYYTFKTEITNSNDYTTLYLKDLDNDTDYKGWWIKILTDTENSSFSGHVREIIDYNTTDKSITLSYPLGENPEYSIVNNEIGIYPAPIVTFNSINTLITSLTNYSLNTVKCTLNVNHNFTQTDINKEILFINTTCIPSIDGYQSILGIIRNSSNNSFYINASITADALYSTNNTYVGSIPYDRNVIRTNTFKIRNIKTTAQTFLDYGLENATTIELYTGDGGYTTYNEFENIYFNPGDKIMIQNAVTTPPTVGIYTIYGKPYLNDSTFFIDHTTLSVDSVENAYVGTDIITVTCPEHGFNFIQDITNVNTTVTVTTVLPHNLSIGSIITFRNTGIQILDANGEENTLHYTVTRVDNVTFDIEADLPASYNVENYRNVNKYGYCGIVGVANDFRLYNCKSLGGINALYLNNIPFTVFNPYDVSDISPDRNTNAFVFHCNQFATSTAYDGDNIYISSFKHGFRGTQTNVKNNILTRSINLEGENYAFLCCPQLGSVLNTGSVKDIFARIILDQSPGAVVFNFLSNPKTFENVPLKSLEKLNLSMLNYDGTEYIFNDLDYSFTLEITEVIDTVDNFNISSRRGIQDIKPSKD